MILLLIWLACAVGSALIAGNKGRSSFAWFFIGLLFGIFGFLAVLIVSDLRAAQAAIDAQAAGAIEQANLRKCPYCAEQIKREAIVCRFCGRDLPVDTTEAEFSAWLAAQNPPLTNVSGEDRASYRQAWLAGRT